MGRGAGSNPFAAVTNILGKIQIMRVVNWKMFGHWGWSPVELSRTSVRYNETLPFCEQNGIKTRTDTTENITFSHFRWRSVTIK